MNLILSSVQTKEIFLGLVFLILFFLVSVIITLGIKALFLMFDQKFFYKEKRKQYIAPKPKKPIKSIEINPDEVDRILVKKD